jgi:hypothetical protein
MATVDSSDMVVVAELGVPLHAHCQPSLRAASLRGLPYGASPGVPGSDGGGGRLISVGALLVIVDDLVR